MRGCWVTALIFVVFKMPLRHPLKSYFVPLVLAGISDLLLLRVHTIVPYPRKPRKHQLSVIEGFQYRLMVMLSLKLYKSKNGKGSSFEHLLSGTLVSVVFQEALWPLNCT